MLTIAAMSKEIKPKMIVELHWAPGFIPAAVVLEGAWVYVISLWDDNTDFSGILLSDGPHWKRGMRVVWDTQHATIVKL
jgi:hypothetical protein